MLACNVLYSSITFQLSKGDIQYVQAGFINHVLSERQVRDQRDGCSLFRRLYVYMGFDMVVM